MKTVVEIDDHDLLAERPEVLRDFKRRVLEAEDDNMPPLQCLRIIDPLLRQPLVASTLHV